MAILPFTYFYFFELVGFSINENKIWPYELLRLNWWVLVARWGGRGASGEGVGGRGGRGQTWEQLGDSSSCLNSLLGDAHSTVGWKRVIFEFKS